MTRSKIAIIGFILFFWNLSVGQNGNYFITNLTPTDDRIDPRSIGIAQNELGVIYYTNKNGILEFDGNNWKLIPTAGSVYTIISSSQEIFAGGSFGFGVLVPSTGHGDDFKLLSNKPNIFSSQFLNDKIYFCSEHEIFSYSLKEKVLDKITITAGADNFFTGVHRIAGEAYATSVTGGLQKIENGRLVASEVILPAEESLMFSIPINTKEALFGTESGKLYRYKEGQAVEPLVLADLEFLDINGLVNGTLVSENTVALGTLKGGVIFIDFNTGATKEIIDYNIGLPDNDVLALFTDRNKGVWVAHEYGFSRIAPYFPFRSFNRYPGLSGNLLCVQEIDGKLFAGTSLGLYFLNAEELYEEVEVIQRSTNVITPVVVQKEKTRKKLFGFLRNKKKEAEAEAEAEAILTEPVKTKTTIKRTTKRVLKSRHYVYQKVEGVNGKITQLLNVNGETIVAGLAGVFKLNGTVAEPILLTPVRYVFHSPTLNQLFVSTFDDRTISLAPTEKAWQETHYVDTLRDYISYIFEDHLQNIWFCAKSTIYKMELLDQAIVSFQALPIHNPLYDETVGISLGNEVYIAVSGVFKKYDNHQSFVNYDSLPGPKKYFASAGNFWFNDGHRWRTINRKIQAYKLEWLGMFPNLRYLTPSSDGNGLWIVTAKNELYKFTNPTDDKESNYYPLFLRDVRGDQIKLIDKNLRMDQSENTVYFEFTQPNYMGFRANEFRYMVHGLTKDWSPWSNVNNLISFSYLPPGEYRLAVQSRDILGNVSEVEMVSFEVLPYYWKRWWFYALEFTFFSMLVLLSVKLGRGNQRYKLISQILSLLTVILLIQFIETGINSLVELKSTPVVEFLIQLGITVVVFPVETKLQQLMQFVSVGRTKN